MLLCCKFGIPTKYAHLGVKTFCRKLSLCKINDILQVCVTGDRWHVAGETREITCFIFLFFILLLLLLLSAHVESVARMRDFFLFSNSFSYSLGEEEEAERMIQGLEEEEEEEGVEERSEETGEGKKKELKKFCKWRKRRKRRKRLRKRITRIITNKLEKKLENLGIKLNNKNIHKIFDQL